MNNIEKGNKLNNEPNLVENKNGLYYDIKSRLSNLQNFLLYGNQKEQSSKTKEELLNLKSTLIEEGEKYTKPKEYNIEKNTIKSTKVDLDELKKSVNPFLEIYKEFENRFNHISQKFGNNFVLSIIKDMIDYKFDINDESDRGRVDSILSLLEETPYFIAKNFLV